MGYTTDFYGQIEINPPLDSEMVEYINKLASTRRMKRDSEKLMELYHGENGLNGSYGVDGEYFVGGLGSFGQDSDESVLSTNGSPSTQPGLWLQWNITEDGKFIQWDEGEKFYNATEWMEYVISLISENHVCNGTIEARGEDPSDHWLLKVENNIVSEDEYSYVSKIVK